MEQAQSSKSAPANSRPFRVPNSRTSAGAKPHPTNHSPSKNDNEADKHVSSSATTVDRKKKAKKREFSLGVPKIRFSIRVKAR